MICGDGRILTVAVLETDYLGVVGQLETVREGFQELRDLHVFVDEDGLELATISGCEQVRRHIKDNKYI